MKVLFTLYFPIIDPVTGTHNWQEASVFIPTLNLTAKEVKKLAEKVVLIWGSQGCLGSLIGLAQLLREKTALPDNDLDLEPATILWGTLLEPDFPGMNVNFRLDYSEGRIYIGPNEFRIRDLIDESDLENEFIHYIETENKRSTETESDLF